MYEGTRGIRIGKSVKRKIVLMLSVLGVMVILACFLNSSALKYVAGFNDSIAEEVENLKMKVTDFIMSQSTKDINKFNNKFSSILY